MVKVVVAHSMAKNGGPCGECGRQIGKGQYIGKVVKDGQHRGSWVCRYCAAKYPQEGEQRE